MVDAILVLKEREDREEAWASERGHPQVFGLEGESDHKARVAEVALELLAERFPRFHVRGSGHQGWANVVLERVKGAFEDRSELRELGSVVVQVLFELSDVRRRQLGDLCIHLIHVVGAVQVSAGTESDSVLRIESLHRNLSVDVVSDRLENFL